VMNLQGNKNIAEYCILAQKWCQEVFRLICIIFVKYQAALIFRVDTLSTYNRIIVVIVSMAILSGIFNRKDLKFYAACFKVI